MENSREARSEAALKAAQSLAGLVHDGLPSVYFESGILVAPYFCSEGLSRLLLERAPSGYDIAHEGRTGEVELLRVAKTTRGNRLRPGRAIEGYLLISEAPPLARVFTADCCSIQAEGFWDFTHHCVSRLLEALYPLATAARVSSSVLVDILQGCDEAVHKVSIYRATLRPSGGGSDTSRRPEGTEMSVRELLAQSEALGAAIDKVAFALHDHVGRRLLDAFLSRDGFVRYHAGSLARFRDLVLSRIEHHAAAAWQELGLVEQASRQARLLPVQIEFGDPVFGSVDDNIRLLQVFDEDSCYALSVQHWNPYLRATVMDYVDGSRFTLASGETNSLLVIPGPNTSRASLHRIGHRITAEFAEGTMINKPDLEVRLPA